MTKDYAKKRRLYPQTKSRPRFAHSSQEYTPKKIPSWAWMSTGLILGLSLSSFIFWKQSPHSSEHRSQSSQQQLGKKLSSSDNQKGRQAASKPSAAKTKETRFDFYTLLPNLTKDLSEEPPLSSVSAATNPSPLSEAGSKKEEKVLTPPLSKSLPEQNAFNYIVQAGSFKHLYQAEELKAQLALTGFEPRIQTVKIANNETWYRVYMGPFAAKENALKSQQRLEQAHHRHSLVLKIRV